MIQLVDLFLPLHSLALVKYLLLQGYIKLLSEVWRIVFAGIRNTLLWICNLLQIWSKRSACELDLGDLSCVITES